MGRWLVVLVEELDHAPDGFRVVHGGIKLCGFGRGGKLDDTGGTFLRSIIASDS